jgi:tetratricopeptide (TPR) repeat protein
VSSFSFSTTVHALDRDYTVKSMNFESLRRIIINLSDHDRVLNTRDVPYDASIADEELMNLVKRKHEERVENLQELLKISSKLEQKNDMDANHKLGLVFLNNGLGREAAIEFERSLGQEPNRAPVMNHLGLAYLQEERMLDAEKIFRQALALKPEYPDLHNHLGMALLKSGNYVEALAEFQRALEIHPGYAEAYFNYALCLLAQATADNSASDAVKADLLQHLNRAVELNAYYNNEYFKVAQSHLAKNQLAECRHALVEAKTSVSSQTGSEVFHEFYLRLKYGDEGVDRKATERYISRLEELLDKNPQFVDVHNDLGVAYLIQCRFLFNRAINEFKRALALNPNYSKAQKNLKLAENEGKGFLILLRAILYF